MRRGPSFVRALALGAAVVVACVAACGGQSQAPPAADQTLACEATLPQACCDDTNGQTCIQNLADAELCGNWPTGATVLTYASACGGYQVVSVKLPTNTFTKYYLYAAAAGQTLYAIADDANANAQGAPEIECGAGPTGFTVPTSCSTVWLDASQGAACTPGATTTFSPSTVPCN
jgi:hypothetical protein